MMRIGSDEPGDASQGVRGLFSLPQKHVSAISAAAETGAIKLATPVPPAAAAQKPARRRKPGEMARIDVVPGAVQFLSGPPP
jgi:hypothetical protein